MGKELMELCDKLCEGAKVLTKEITPIIDKGNITPQELDTLHKAAIFAEKLAKAESILDGGMSYDMSNSMSYGMHMPMDMNMNGISERRGTSPVTGRYISRGMHGMSGHSVEDRMIAALEEEMDNTNSDYERGVIQNQIHKIRRGER